MLLLSRKKNETIRIGDNIKVTIVGISHGKVQVGIEAPPNISVHRQEVYLAVQERLMRAQQSTKERNND